MKLGSLGEIFIGLTYKPDDVSENGTIVLRSSNIQDGHLDFNDIIRVKCNIRDKLYVHENDILMCSRNGSALLVGKCTIIPQLCEKMTFGAFMTVIRTPINQYLRYFFESECFRKQLKGSATTTINQITRSMLDEIDVPIYDIKQQNQIVSSLTQVYSLIELRKQQLSKLDELVKARFVEMFGDPMTNSNGYILKKYGDLFELNAGGTPSKKKSEYWDNGTISWIGSNMCQNTVIYENDGNYITKEGLEHSSARMFPVDTVLIALVGATIGKTALLKFETTTNQNVLGVRGIRESGYTSEFVFYYTQGLYQKFLNIGDGGFAMASKGFISELPVPVVDLALQKQFTTFVEQIDKSKAEIQKSLEKLETLKKALMQKYFG